MHKILTVNFRIINFFIFTLERGFKKRLGLFLTRGCSKYTDASGSIYLNNMKLEYDTYPTDLIAGRFNITVGVDFNQHFIS